MKLYHYTSLKNWQSILASGFLEARTLPVNTRFNDIRLTSISASSVNLIKHDAYIVALLSPFDSGWIASGLFDLMCRKTTSEVCLGFTVDNIDGVFVREHALCSPRLFVDNYGVDLRNLVIRGVASTEQIDIYKSHVLEYLDSVTPLRDYKGGFTCPEFRYPYNVPVSKLALGVDNHF